MILVTSMKACMNCGADADHEHHVVPRSLGGVGTVPLCEGCHGKVHDSGFVNHRILTRIALMKKHPEEACRVLWLMYDGCDSVEEVVGVLAAEGYQMSEGKIRSLIYRMMKIPARVLVYECFGWILGSDETGERAKESLECFIEEGGLIGFPGKAKRPDFGCPTNSTDDVVPGEIPGQGCESRMNQSQFQ